MMQGGNLFGALVRHHRQNLGLSRAELAERVACSIETLKKIETGQRRPSREMARALARSLHIPEDEQENFIALARGRRKVSQMGNDQAGVGRGRTMGNLPWPLTGLIGRTAERNAVGRLLARDDVRLLTLVGAPGVGKTRLALEVAKEAHASFQDGVWFVPLAPITPPAWGEEGGGDLLLSSLAATFDAPLAHSHTLFEQLCRYLQSKQALLLFDNIEHLLAAAPVISDLLLSCRGLKALVTSRVPLNLYGEHQLSVPPFPTPPPETWNDPPRLRGYAAVRLFLARAQAYESTFELTAANAPAIAELCVRLDGIALALELAAACVRGFTPRQLLAEFRLNHGRRLDLLSGTAANVPPRQQTLRNAIAHSYMLLTTSEQQLFEQLAIFNDPFELDEAWAVASWIAREGAQRPPEPTAPQPEFMRAFQSLLNHHLVQRQPGEQGEAYILLDTLREFARERLEMHGRIHDVRRGHAYYHASLARAVDPTLTGGDLQTWRTMLRRRRSDLQAALAWAIEHASINPMPALQLAAGLSHFWYVEGLWQEGIQWLQAVQAALPDWTGEIKEEGALRARVSTGLGILCTNASNYGAAADYFQQALTLARCAEDHTAAAWTISQLAHMAELQGDYAASARYAQESLEHYRALDAHPYVALLLERLAVAAIETGDYATGDRYLEEGLALFRQLGSKGGVASLCNLRGMVLLAQGHAESALAWFVDAYKDFDEIQQSHGIAWTLRNLALANLCLNQPAIAVRQLSNALELYTRMGSRDALLMLVEGFAGAAVRSGYMREAQILMETARHHRRAMSLPLSSNVQAIYARIWEEPPAAVQRKSLRFALETNRSHEITHLTLDEAIQLAQRLYFSGVTTG